MTDVGRAIIPESNYRLVFGNQVILFIQKCEREGKEGRGN